MWEKCECLKYISQTKISLHPSCRFVYSPMIDVEKRLSAETVELKSDISNLNKKLHYLETTHKNSREHIDKIIQSGGRS